LAKQVRTSYYTARRAVLRFKNSQTIKDKSRIGRPKGSANKKLEKKVVSIIRKNKSMSIRDIAKKAGTSHVMVVKVKKRNSIRAFKKQKAPKRTQQQTLKSIHLVRKLYEQKFDNKKEWIVLDDEIYVKMDFCTLAGPQFYSIVLGDIISDSEKIIRHEKFGEKY